MNVHNVLVKKLCLFLTFSASCWSLGFCSGGAGTTVFSNGFDSFFSIDCGFCCASGGTSGGAAGFVSAFDGSSRSTSTLSSVSGSAAGDFSVCRASPFARTAGWTTSSSVCRSSVGRATASTALLTSSRGFVTREGLSRGVSGGLGDAVPFAAFPFARAAARAAFSCARFSARANAFCFFSALLDGGASSVLHSTGQTKVTRNQSVLFLTS